MFWKWWNVFWLCQVLESSLYTDAAVLYSDRIVLNGPDLNEISCYLQKQPGEQEEAALARWGGGGGGGQTIDYISYSISNRKQTRHNTDTQSDLRTPFKAISGWHWNILNIIKLWEPTHHFHHYPEVSKEITNESQPWLETTFVLMSCLKTAI